MLIDVNVYSEQLKSLWHKVFGDDEEYISLLFDNNYTPAECFGYVDNGRVVSVLYLLSSSIKVDNSVFKGRYLYAAATLDEYRGRGLMSELIRESQEYVFRSGFDYIALVPASESLYDYYAKFNFKPLMYNYASVYEGKCLIHSNERISLEEVIEIRKNISADSFHFDENEMGYAYSCLEYAGYGFYKNSDDSYYIADEEKKEILEYLSSDENYDINTENFFSHIGDATITSPYNFEKYCKSIKQKFGMIYSSEQEVMKNFSDGIYMNIALD